MSTDPPPPPVRDSLPTRRPCPVCGAPCSPLGIVDFNKCCEERRGLTLRPSGRDIVYLLCERCAFCFSPDFATWKPEDFAREIYNDDYVRVDPDYADVRPRASANFLLSSFGDRIKGIRHLDYGGGAGLMSRLLREAGWDSLSYDPFADPDVDPELLGQFELITCFEVFEHVADVNALARMLASRLADNGLLIFSTLVSDGCLTRGRPIDWWYASPRNGHISLFSSRSLAILARNYRFSFGSFSAAMHAFWRQQFPPWASHLLKAQ